MSIDRIYFFLTFLVIAISGNPMMGALGKETVYIGSLMVFVALWRLRPLKPTRQDMLVICLFFLFTLAHMLNYGSLVVAASLGFLIKLGIALLAVRLIPEFNRRYVTVMYLLSLISFVFFVPMKLGVDMQSMLSPFQLPTIGLGSFHIGIHNLRTEYGEIRNMGMFWEPGAFAGYLILALFFLIRDELTVLTKRGLVLTLALLTTQSTTGYLVFMVLIAFAAYKSGLFKRPAAKLLVMPALFAVLTYGASILFSEVPFLGKKITSQIESASLQEDSSRINRFGNFMYDVEWIKDKPILGWSANPETRLVFDPEVLDLASGQGNGLTGFAIKFGVSGLMLFLGFFAYNTWRISGSLQTSLFGLVIVCALLNGEQFLGFPMFLSLMFLPQRKSNHLSALNNEDVDNRSRNLADKKSAYSA